MQKLSIVVFFGIIFLMLGGCGAIVSKPAPPNNQAVWADDGSGIAIAILSSAETGNEPLGAAKTSNGTFSHQIFVQNPDGSGRTLITDARQGRNGVIYYMKTQGYLVVETLLDNGGVKYDKISLSGNKEITIIETSAPNRVCKQEKNSIFAGKSVPVVPHAVIPSPDGKTLAHVYSQACAEATVDFLSAKDLVTLDSQLISIQRPAQAAWHADGYLLVTLDDGRTAWKINVNEDPVPASYPECKDLKTASSAVAADGRMVYMEGPIVKFRQLNGAMLTKGWCVWK
ncbi:MAG: hypothetical protein GY862_11805 [Gammaproteobacteria bacterium]|nr:hypothetical protein [Gammaproteobacteria bacterium]